MRAAETFLEIEVRGLDQQRAAVGHCVACVDRQVHQDLVHLPGVGQHRSQARAENRFQPDIFPDYPAQHLRHFKDDVVQVHFLRLNNLFPAQHQQLPAQRGGPFAGGSDFGDKLSRGVVWSQFAEEHVAIPIDHREEVVEIVRHAAREPANRLQLLRLQQPALHFQALGDVARHSQEFADLALLIPQQCDRHFGARQRPILAHLVDLMNLCSRGRVIGCRRRHHIREAGGGVFTEFRGKRNHHIFPQKLFRGISEQVLQRRTDIGVLAGACIHQPDHVCRILRDQPIAFLAGPKRRLSPLAFGDVRAGTAISYEFASVVEIWDAISGYPDDPAILSAHRVFEIKERLAACKDVECGRPERLSSFVGMNIAEMLLADQFLGRITKDRL